MTATDPTVDEYGRPEPPSNAGELETLTGFLDYQRATLAWKTHGLDADALNTSVAASSITLGGLLKHMAYVESHWFWRWLRGDELAAPWATVDWEADRDWDWHSAAADTPEELRSLWEASVERARSCVEEALVAGGLDQKAKRVIPEGWAPSLRWILTHMIEEYARHNGHADFIRETIDGEVGE